MNVDYAILCASTVFLIDCRRPGSISIDFRARDYLAVSCQENWSLETVISSSKKMSCERRDTIGGGEKKQQSLRQVNSYQYTDSTLRKKICRKETRKSSLACWRTKQESH